MESRIELLDDEGSKRVCSARYAISIRTADLISITSKAITEQVLLSALKVTHLILIADLFILERTPETGQRLPPKPCNKSKNLS